ncbi:MAG: prepilin-type N-terminal cleavage/methylation domain-containing protein [Acidobacteria bacterium]|nr:prepilin-type N-terminal cleavage/methylation domain-containing protein [Acidobacteriota bacterium]MCI0722729.1 prepilin-type N-terminal cleavage/methylation domain-containing protein [Acidobacteriota bacterium]
MRTKPGTPTQHGFSLLELLIVLAVFSFIVGGIFSNLSQSQVRYQFEQEVAEVQQAARNAVDIMEREIKLAGFPKPTYYDSALNWTSANSERVAAGFITINATNVIFEADVEEDGIVDLVEYRLNNGTLERSAQDKPAGGGTPAAVYQTLATNVTALTFSYLNSSGSATTTASEVRSVGILFNINTTNVDPQNRNQRTITVQTMASVRN